MVEVIRGADCSPAEVFRSFDLDKDGTIDQSEFMKAVASMNIQMSADEQKIFFLFIDLDGKGYIKYSEFLRILKRCGLESVTSEEKIVHLIYDIIQRNQMTVLQVYEAIDANKSNSINCEELTRFLQSMDVSIKRELIN